MADPRSELRLVHLLGWSKDWEAEGLGYTQVSCHHLPLMAASVANTRPTQREVIVGARVGRAAMHASEPPEGPHALLWTTTEHGTGRFRSTGRQLIIGSRLFTPRESYYLYKLNFPCLPSSFVIHFPSWSPEWLLVRSLAGPVWDSLRLPPHSIL